jgi:5-oxoprolinase (ATP-hydrolysing)
VPSKWLFSIDRGGTFTDVVAIDPQGRLQTAKLLSVDPEKYDDAVVAGIRQAMGVSPGEAMPTDQIGVVKVGTTVATNALLERKGVRTLFVTNRGLGDVLRIGTQQRPRLFELRIDLPEPLYAEVIEVDGRVDANGELLEPLDEAGARQSFQRAFADGFEAVAIALMHAYRFPAHEQRLAKIAAEVGFAQVTASHVVSALVKIVNRAGTAVANAYLSPILTRYIASLQEALSGVRLEFMTSNGGLTESGLFEAKDAILSGPAGGVVGAAQTAKGAGFDRIIGFDMGGTSTDVCHFAGDYERRLETHVAGVRLCIPMMHIHTVAAGGGSICRYDGEKLRVGPESAGASPGPACYRRGGPLTVTDCNVVLGRIQPDWFPAVFGAGGGQRLDVTAARAALEEIGRQVDNRSAEELAEGFLRIAVENMATAIKAISVARGYDVSRYALMTFGGAGGQHACAIAESLGMKQILIHSLAGVLSAYGIALAEVRAHREATVESALDAPALRRAVELANQLEQQARAEIAAQSVAIDRVQRRLLIKFAGSDTALAVDLSDLDRMRREFLQLHRLQYGFVMEKRALRIDAVNVEVIGAATLPRAEPPAEPGEPRVASQSVYGLGGWQETGLFLRDRLRSGSELSGPALLAESTATTWVAPGWTARVLPGRELLLERGSVNASVGRPARPPAAPEPGALQTPDPVLLELYNRRFESVAEQMGAVLQKTAYSVNIKERLDYSCAVFDSDGRLVANAPHIPVHLGSMSAAVQEVIRVSRPRQGDVFILNDPYAGGTHLPDITVVTPMFLRNGVLEYRSTGVLGPQNVASPQYSNAPSLHYSIANESRPLFWLASRGHHADVGGIAPGSMPAMSRSIEEEGVLIRPFLLVDQGRFREEEFFALLTQVRHPARNPEQNLGDVRAQVAANGRGVHQLARLLEENGLDEVLSYTALVRQNAAQTIRRALSRLDNGAANLEMDCEARICARISIDHAQQKAVVDFAGSSPVQPTNFNAPAAVVKAAVLYVFRCLAADDIPLNDGCLEPIEIRVPPQSLLSPQYPAAVVAGNVENSQVIANALFLALGQLAASQGTMNNLTFGNAQHQYYETICGGSGAGPGFGGASGVHSHMTNSRLTDAEVLEFRYPVILEQFTIRNGSGGRGRWRGGNGVVRALRFRESMEVSILSNHRRIGPAGLAGGDPGLPGRNRVERADGSVEELGATATVLVGPGDRILIETPGGGGYGKVIGNR